MPGLRTVTAHSKKLSLPLVPTVVQAMVPYKLEFFVDGGYRRIGSGRTTAVAAAAAVQIRHHANGISTSHKSWTRALPLDHRTSSERAEITAMIMGLECALHAINTQLPIWDALPEGRPEIAVAIHSDAQNVTTALHAHRLGGRRMYLRRPIKFASRDLAKQAIDLQSRLMQIERVKLKYVWLPREENRLADAYCNEKLDEMERGDSESKETQWGKMMNKSFRRITLE